ncbi:hypothetical protein D6T64_02195 [Cryobacterium melibiosiphilum]|uniref:DUF2975 domain-containing protein n=2 Tax=Cryobacterium melibiosiphilum TaxID=995039 RepID=A0A3A5N1R6_9MICO|nr:hypothetical protein [Cryobacterium melibiosiphilum]RJT91204.1 hypothetical protein D6T64_02195 [Cryobacterium melibiosiphilum]
MSIMSIAAIGYAAFQICIILADMIDRIAHRATGIALTWNPGILLPQPASVTYSGAPFVVPGSTAHVTDITAMVKDLPVAAIVLQSIGDLVSVLTIAGIAVCILILVRRVAAGTPFAPASIRTLVTLAIVVLIGFESATVLHGVSAMSVPSIMFVSPESPDGTYWPPPEAIPLFVLWPVYISAALVALAAVFRAGAGYQADRSGLV